MLELTSVFINVIMPVFAVVLLGAVLGKRLELQARTLTRAAYFVFVPAYIFQAIAGAAVPLGSAMRMVLFILVSHLLAALVAGIIGRLLGRSREMIAAFVMIAVFGNIGNYGLAVIGFHLGDAAMVPATIYFVAITVNAFVVCVAAAGWARGGSRSALWQVFKTPALWAAVLALIVSGSGVEPPLLLERMLGLLADAMIPIMLFALGLQLREQGRVQFNVDVLLASGIRLLLVPALTVAVALFVPLTSLERVAGILQAGMPTAILVAIIARENNIVPAFVTSVVVVSTLISLLTLTLLMVLL